MAAVTICSDFGAQESEICHWFHCFTSVFHEMKRCLLLGRKAMTNLDTILKSRDITLPTNVHLVEAMVFPVVVYRFESWKAER